MFPLWSIWDVPWALQNVSMILYFIKTRMILMMKLWFEDNCYDPFIN